ncbi:DUF4294 domain-containing protein [Flavobacterium sp. SUN046]|jgi:hypothetical protein|uniref:DUF4294 domain-containing protein n=1 Tax=Flavobacterium sp. SUN046 TaxID=3002440 RepID=UPI002DBC20CC|nr:DUF4294 domain-containing protein [Flavobacterium sp. SUN046]MEC4048299.1 DUF4294 domain-containing protein [Flavobacterium sp. SUN046]
MKRFHYLFLISLFSLALNAQVSTVQDTTRMGYVLKEGDTISDKPILLEEVFIHSDKLDPEAKKQFLLLQNRVYKVFPYARIASDKLNGLNATMSKLKTEKEKRKYFKIVEEYMDHEFKDQLKKLSRKQGQILVKLIYRQTGFTTYELIREHKSGWKAFWSNNTARLFDINLKTKYAPFEVNEDYLIETILSRAFIRGRLVEQKAANPVDIDDLDTFWEEKAKELSLKK